MQLANLTYPEARRVIERGAIGLWPIGSTEAHGPHLPLDTDVRIASETCLRAEHRLQLRFGWTPIVLPPLSFTVTDFAEPFAGTLSISPATAEAYLREVILAASRQGFRALCLVNAHLEPAHRHALRAAVTAARPAALCPVGIADPGDRRFAHTLTEEFKKGACHAGCYETSLLLAIDPALVREELRRALDPKDIDLLSAMKHGAKTFVDAGASEAYFGDPRAATATEGDETFDRLGAMLETVVAELLTVQGENPT